MYYSSASRYINYKTENMFYPTLICYFSSGSCVTCDPDKHLDIPLLKSYHDFIKTLLLPHIKRLIKSYSVFWCFKADSELYNYLSNRNIKLQKYFLLSDLYCAFNNFAKINLFSDPGNSNIILPDNELQKIFNTYVLYKPELMKFLLDHVQVAPIEQIIKLQSDNIQKLLYVKPPNNLIYKNQSSLFWVHPGLNYILNKNQKIYYTWNEIKSLFLDFITSSPLHISRVNDSFFYIHPTSELKQIFKFTYFNIAQIEDILKIATKYLGKTNGLNGICPLLQFESSILCSKAFQIIDNLINIHRPIHFPQCMQL
jgi:hypothetical protein